MNSGVHKSNYEYAQIYSKFDSFHFTYSISFFLINIDLPSLEPVSLFFAVVCSFDVSASCLWVAVVDGEERPVVFSAAAAAAAADRRVGVSL